MVDIVAKHRLSTAMKKRIPSAADAETRVLDEVLIFCEKQVGKWVGTYLVRRFIDEGKILELDIEDRFIPGSSENSKCNDHKTLHQ